MRCLKGLALAFTCDYWVNESFVLQLVESASGARSVPRVSFTVLGASPELSTENLAFSHKFQTWMAGAGVTCGNGLNEVYVKRNLGDASGARTTPRVSSWSLSLTPCPSSPTCTSPSSPSCATPCSSSTWALEHYTFTATAAPGLLVDLGQLPRRCHLSLSSDGSPGPGAPPFGAVTPMPRWSLGIPFFAE